MIAKHKFREGWIMLKRPFKFGELSKPLQKMTVLYAFSEKPIITMELNAKGIEEMKILHESYGKGIAVFGGDIKYKKRFGEDEDSYEERIAEYTDQIFRAHSTQENYQGEIVQCYVEGEMCRFYPEEYSIISKETFDHLLACDDQEYTIDVESEEIFETKALKERLFYIRSRGISKNRAMKMNCGEARDAVIFRPGQAILEMFCREHEIY